MFLVGFVGCTEHGHAQWLCKASEQENGKREKAFELFGGSIHLGLHLLLVLPMNIALGQLIDNRKHKEPNHPNHKRSHHNRKHICLQTKPKQCTPGRSQQHKSVSQSISVSIISIERQNGHFPRHWPLATFKHNHQRSVQRTDGSSTWSPMNLASVEARMRTSADDTRSPVKKSKGQRERGCVCVCACVCV